MELSKKDDSSCNWIKVHEWKELWENGWHHHGSKGKTMRWQLGWRPGTKTEWVTVWAERNRILPDSLVQTQRRWTLWWEKCWLWTFPSVVSHPTLSVARTFLSQHSSFRCLQSATQSPLGWNFLHLVSFCRWLWWSHSVLYNLRLRWVCFLLRVAELIYKDAPRRQWWCVASIFVLLHRIFLPDWTSCYV